MNRIVRILVSSVALCCALAGVSGVASADVGRGGDRAPAAHVVAHEEPRGMARGEAHGVVVSIGDRGDRFERDRAEHARACDIAYHRGASFRQLRDMGCYVR